MFAPHMIAMKLHTLKHLLMRHLALFSLWTSHMSTHIIAISDLGDTLITRGLEVTVELNYMKIFTSIT